MLYQDMLTLEQFKGEIETGIKSGDLSPVNDVDLCNDLYTFKPLTFWTFDIDSMTVQEFNVNYFPKSVIDLKFGITWGEILDYSGKKDIKDLSDDEIKTYMLDLIDSTDCVTEWYDELYDELVD
jgi:hypothetical protein